MGKFRTDKPPKDRPFIATIISYPLPVVVVFNESSNDYVYARLSIDLYDGKWNDSYFENEEVKSEEILGWMDFPEVMK